MSDFCVMQIGLSYIFMNTYGIAPKHAHLCTVRPRAPWRGHKSIVVSSRVVVRGSRKQSWRSRDPVPGFWRTTKCHRW